MAWNEPGNSGDKDKNRDPWSNRPNPQGGPPDLDEVFKNLRKKITGMFGGGGKGGIGTGSSGGGRQDNTLNSIASLILALLVLWLVYDTTYIIDQSERGVVLRLGKYVDSLQPGVNFRFPRPVETVQKVNVSEILPLALKARLLTKDQNLINISLVVRFRVQDEIKYALKVREPALALRESTESALREAVGNNTLDDILRESAGRAKLISDTKNQIQQIMDKFQTGLLVDQVNLEDSQPPEQVQDAFRDAVKASNDAERFISQAQATANSVVPKAEAEAEKMILEATGYKKQVIDKAEGEASRFLQVLREYNKAPAVTRKRMYLETVEYVLSNSSKVMIKVQKGNNIMYLPIDRFLNERQREALNNAAAPARSDDKSTELTVPVPSTGTGRDRDVRSR